MNDPLQELRDIHLPAFPDGWPLAPGWWVLLAVILVVIALGVWAFRYYQELQYSAPRVALLELERLQGQYAQDHDAQGLIVGLSALMRRTAISIYPRQEVASLSGQQWLLWLDHHSDHDKPFSQGVAKILADAPYQPTLGEVDCDSVVQTCQQWIAYQRRRGSSHV